MPQTEQACSEVLSLPLHLGLKDEDVARDGQRGAPVSVTVTAWWSGAVRGGR